MVMEDVSWDRLDSLVDTDPIKLRDLAFALASERDELRAKAVVVATEYEREPRQLSSGAVAEMLREWVGVYR